MTTKTSCPKCDAMRNPPPSTSPGSLAGHLEETGRSGNSSTTYVDYRCPICATNWVNTRDVEDHGSYWSESPAST